MFRLVQVKEQWRAKLQLQWRRHIAISRGKNAPIRSDTFTARFTSFSAWRLFNIIFIMLSIITCPFSPPLQPEMCSSRCSYQAIMDSLIAAHIQSTNDWFHKMRIQWRRSIVIFAARHLIITLHLFHVCPPLIIKNTGDRKYCFCSIWKKFESSCRRLATTGEYPNNPLHLVIRDPCYL